MDEKSPAVDVMEFGAMKVTQEEANYDPLGAIAAKGEKGCGICRWFIRHGGGNYGCQVVEEWPADILPTGLSNRFEVAPEPEEPDPLKVEIVAGEAQKNGGRRILGSMLSGIKGLFEKAVWSTATVNDFPDANFLYIAPGGEKNGDGKTVPRSNRKFPYKNKAGNVDLPHLRNALARIPQSSLPQNIKDRVNAKARRIAKAEGIEVAEKAILDYDDLVGETGFLVKEVADGTPWWVGWTSNKWRDDEGEIFSDHSHKEYVAGRDAEQIPPGDVSVFHVPGTSFAKAVGVDYVDGFLVEWGPFKKGFEEVAERLKEDDWAMSHSFVALRDEADKSVYTHYRILERGPLPRQKAANQWTGFAVQTKEAIMGGFDPEKRAVLVKIFTEEWVQALEDKNEKAVEELVALGVDTKEASNLVGILTGEEGEATSKTDPEEEKPEVEATEVVAGIKEMAKALREEFGLDELDTGLKELRETIETRLDAMEASVKELQKSDDEKVAETIAPKAKIVQWGFRASQAEATMTEADGRTKEAKEAKQGPTLEGSEGEPTALKRSVAGLIGVAGGANGQGA